jgi:hypothetical protein
MSARRHWPARRRRRVVSRVAARTSRYWQPTDAANGPELSAIFRAAEQLASTDHHVIHRVIRQNLEARGVFDGYEVGTDVDGVSFYQPAGDPMTAFQHRADRIELTDRYQKVAIGEVLDRIHGLHQQISEEYRGDNFDTVHRLDREAQMLLGIAEARPDYTQAVHQRDPGEAVEDDARGESPQQRRNSASDVRPKTP